MAEGKKAELTETTSIVTNIQVYDTLQMIIESEIDKSRNTVNFKDTQYIKDLFFDTIVLLMRLFTFITFKDKLTIEKGKYCTVWVQVLTLIVKIGLVGDIYRTKKVGEEYNKQNNK